MTDREDESLRWQIADLATQLAELRHDLDKFRTDIQTERVNKAEKHVSYMRDWLGLLTAVITICFVGFSLIGISRWSDIKAYHDQMEAYRNQVQQDAAEVRSQKQQVDQASRRVVQDAGGAAQRLGGLESKITTVESRVAEMESTVGSVDARVGKISKDVNVTRQWAQQSQLNTSNMLTDLAASSGLDEPLILNVPGPALWIRTEQASLNGIGFGASNGHVYAYVESTPLFLPGSVVDQSSRVEISPSSILNWNNSQITFRLSSADIDALDAARHKVRVDDPSALGLPSLYISFQVVTAKGKSSGLSSTAAWPL